MQFVASSFLLLAGCSSYQSPHIQTLDATLIDRSDEALAIQIELNLENPNDEPLELRVFDYVVHVNDRRAYAGKRAAQATLSARGGKTLTIPAVVRFDEQHWDAADPPAQLSWSVRGTLLYVTPGEIAEILLDTGVRKPMATFSGSGNVVVDQEAEKSHIGSPTTDVGAASDPDADL